MPNEIKIKDIGASFWVDYRKRHTKEVMLIDLVLLFSFLTGVFQFLYMVAVGTFPYNSFLAGFFAALGLFVSAGRSASPKQPSSDFSFQCLFIYLSLPPDASG